MQSTLTSGNNRTTLLKPQHTSNAQPTNTAAGSTSRPSRKTTSTQVSNISVEQYATELGVQETTLLKHWSRHSDLNSRRASSRKNGGSRQ